MDRQTAFLLALGLLIVAAAAVSATGWILFVRDRRADRVASADEAEGGEGEARFSSSTDPRSSGA